MRQFLKSLAILQKPSKLNKNFGSVRESQPKEKQSDFEKPQNDSMMRLVNELDEMHYGIKLQKHQGLKTKIEYNNANEELFKQFQANSANDAFNHIQNYLKIFYQQIKEEIIKSDHDYVNKISGHYYSKEGKLVRPSLNFLLSQILIDGTTQEFFQQVFKNNFQFQFNTFKINFFVFKIKKDIVEKQRLWAAVIENIHVSSLVHDDIIDNAFTRRGLETAHVKFGDREAVFSGDYIIGRSGQQISRFNDIRMYQIYSHIMENLTHGEINQANSKRNYKYELDDIINQYILKTYYKTASLMAFSAQGVGIILNQDFHNQECLFKFAQHLGISFQLADDMLDYTSDSAKLGKAALADLKEGNVTGPVLFALQEIDGTEEHKQITAMLQKYPKGLDDNQVKIVDQLVKKTYGLEKTTNLALIHSQRALENLQNLKGVKDIEKKDAYKSLNYLLMKIIKRKS
ncbi:hypothetical protein ABPG72_017357 [Tetrahymena utriculariae]